MRNKSKLKTQKSKLLSFLLFTFYFSLFTFHFSLLLTACAREERIYRESRIVMDTFCTITVVNSSQGTAKKAIDAGFAEIKRLEGLLNFFSDESEIASVNKAAGSHPVKVSTETLDVIKKAVEIADKTGGAFDPTIGPLMRLWGFSDDVGKRSVPSDDKIKSALRLVDYKKIKINALTSEIFLEEKGMELDLGGIAKGYAADRAVSAIKEKKIKAALVAIAGDIRGYGLKPENKSWKVGIQNPRPKDNKPQQETEDVFATLYLKDRAISTSGDYQRYFVENGQRFHHIINPATGYPASDAISVSVLAPEGYIADGISTGIFIMGAEKGMMLLESMGFKGVIIDSNKKMLITKNLKKEIELKNGLERDKN